MRSTRADHLLQLLRQRGSVSATVIADVLQISQPTVSRLLAGLGPQILRIGRARATRYALAREIGRAGSRWPLYRVDASGRPMRLGELRALQNGGFHLQAEHALPALLHGEFACGEFPGLPWFLDDQRPQGFLGRAFARRVSEDIRAPVDPQHWSSDDVVLALLRHGHDQPGDLVLGESALQRALAENDFSPHAVRGDERALRYPQLAEAALHGDPVGSSAAGEQPKFAISVQDEAVQTAVIVKFSEAGGHPAARRWADLLCCEHLASEVLHENGQPAATNTLLDADGRRFLESVRFDRTPHGRIGFVSLAALDAAFHGHGRIDWWRYATELQAEGWLTAVDATHLRRLGWFGVLIGNHDMHLGNAGLLLTDTRPLPLAPAYDMLPMRFRPGSQGEVIERRFEVSAPLPEHREDRLAAAAWAVTFWQRTAADSRISDGFREQAGSIAEMLEAARRRHA